MPTTCLPLPAPHPGCFACSGSKLNRRQLRKVAFQRLLHVWTLVINYMYLGRFPSLAELGRSPNQWQLRCFQRLESSSTWCVDLTGAIPLPSDTSSSWGDPVLNLVQVCFNLEQFLAKTPEMLDTYGAPAAARMKFDKKLNFRMEFPELEPYKSLDR